MDQKILVTYASQYGATCEIAEAIGAALQPLGLPVDVLPVGQVGDLAPYQAVILGSGVYIGQWNKSAVAFIRANEQALAARPVWLFSSGPTGEGDPADLLDGWRLPAALQQVVERIRPRGITVFHGYIDPDKLNFIQRWVITHIVKKPFGDFRDWKVIASWAGAVAAELKESILCAESTNVSSPFRA